MTWVDYMVKAAEHSRGSASHWLRYLRKDINKYGSVFTEKDVNDLFNHEALIFFQRVSIKAAFKEGSPTREYIIGLNKPVVTTRVAAVLEKIKAVDNID